MSFLQNLHNLLPMNLASLSFVYVFLPVSLLLFYSVPAGFRPGVLLTVSVGYYVLSQPRYLWLIAISAAADYILLRAMSLFGERQALRRAVLFVCIAKNLALICYYGLAAHNRMAELPLGLAVSGASGIYAVSDAYRKKLPPEKNVVLFALYYMFFSRMYAGPLMPYGEFTAQFDNQGFDSRGIARGAGRFIEGAFKYAVLGRNLFWLYNSVRLIPQGEDSVLSAWLLVVSFMLSLYFTISGLSDMACGTGGMFGLSLPRNFYYPYQSRSVLDFSRRFNGTVGDFLKVTVYDPLSARYSRAAADTVSMLLVGALSGIWFGPRLNYILWGVCLAAFAIMERRLYPKLMKEAPTLFCRGYTIGVSILSFAFFAGDSPSQGAWYIARMLGISREAAAFLNGRVLYLLSSNWLLLLLGCFLATSATSLAVSLLRKSAPAVSAIVLGAVDFVILALFTAFILGGGRL